LNFSLAEMGPEARAALPELRKARKRATEDLLTAVERALEKIAPAGASSADVN